MKLLALALAGTAVAVDMEFAGFAHFKNWHGYFAGDLQNPQRPLGNDHYLFRYPSGHSPPVGVRKDICSNDPECVGNGGGGAPGECYFNTSAFQDTTYDTYLGIKDVNGSVPAAFCTVEGGGPNSPAVHYLACANDFNHGADGFAANHILNTFALPPDLIHSTCMENPKCIGFRVANNQSTGDILGGWDLEAPAWFKLTTAL
jgi:hypothetical protein